MRAAKARGNARHRFLASEESRRTDVPLKREIADVARFRILVTSPAATTFCFESMRGASENCAAALRDWCRVLRRLARLDVRTRDRRVSLWMCCTSRAASADILSSLMTRPQAHPRVR